MHRSVLPVLLLSAVALATPLQNLRRNVAPVDSDSDEIFNLPGLTQELPFKHYAGYLDLPNSKKHMFYWFVEAFENPSTAPVVLWTNGGPGCSGLIGFLTEQGPFRPMKNMSIHLNDYAWNKVANMLFIEQPAGVGFSYSDNPSDYIVGDDQAASDNYELILQFLGRYPQFASNDFYIASESYGGHYMPTLAKEIVTRNNGTIKFKGFIVGNPLTNMIENAHGMYDTFYGHSVVSSLTHQTWSKSCGNGEDTLQCALLANELSQQAGPLNPYAIDYPVCNDQVLQSGRDQRHRLLSYLLKERIDADSKKMLGLLPPSDYQPCQGNWAATYMNTAEVKKAIHAKADIEWGFCSDKVRYNQADIAIDMVPLYQFLLSGNYNLKMLVFSGDDDAVCGTIGTQMWIWNLAPVKSSWTPWYYDDTEFGKQIGGYIVKFKGISFATVHGAGHEVPAYRPNPALTLFSRYLDGSVF